MIKEITVAAGDVIVYWQIINMLGSPVQHCTYVHDCGTVLINVLFYTVGYA